MTKTYLFSESLGKIYLLLTPLLYYFRF